MKKVYLFIPLLFLITNMNSQIIDDDFESYNLGPMEQQNPSVWRTWSDGYLPEESIEVVSNQSFSGSKSGFIGAGPGPQDAILDLGNLTTGQYTLQFKMYLPTGRGGYFNIQGELPNGTITGVFNSGNITFNPDGIDPGVGVDDQGGYEFNYPERQWFDVSIFFDLDASPAPTYQLTVDGVVANPTPAAFQADAVLGGIDFFAVDANNNYYIDDILFDEGTLSSTDFSSLKISSYPNPVVDKLNIVALETIDKINVFNILGQNVVSQAPKSLNAEVDFSNLNSGTYLVEISIGNQKAVKKIIK
ncbi:T9SS type A sorting domain-containing protein [Psychroflexus salinarum]|uniref:T9SS type A sorting domain-containing protein n=1 Tax=Psychroflexus salinarum TaxID=546024 RepID=A0ABW3GS58_9FLAO